MFSVQDLKECFALQVERGEESLIFTFLVKNEEGHKQNE